MESLKEYKKKRDFSKTNEPRGVRKTKQKKERKFVIQYHKARKTHFDFRFEFNGVLISFAVPKGLSLNPKDKRMAIKVEDHPLDYANFEGVIPTGEYGAGVVLVWDEGAFFAKDIKKGLQNGVLKFFLDGQRVKGNFALIKLKDDNSWLIIKEKDEYVKLNYKLPQTSLKTNKTFEDYMKINSKIKNKTKELNFKDFNLMLCTLENIVPSNDKDYLFEVKYDGYRILAIKDNYTKLYSRNGKDFSNKFENIVKSINDYFKNENIVLDGEVVVLDENGKTDFQKLQNSIKTNSEEVNLAYIVFDILFLNDKDLRDLELIKRKEILQTALQNAPSNIIISDYVIGKGKQCYENSKKLNLEGIVGKKINSKYTGTRNGDWIKIKAYKRQEFVIGGFTISSKRIDGISSLLLGYYDKEKLIYIGKAGTGFTNLEMQELRKKFKKYILKNCKFENTPKISKNEKVFYLKPKYVAEIQYVEITDEHNLRQASFKGLRVDKEEKDVVLEETPNNIKKVRSNNKADKIAKNKTKSNENNVCGVEISSPDKILFKENKITKLDLVKYYEKVSKLMLKYVENRILSVVRCHNGASSECFYKKHPNVNFKEIKKVKVKNDKGELDEYFYIDSEKGLIREVQNGTIEFHTSSSKVKNINKPDIMVFDLDPDENLSLEKVREGVKDLKKVLDSLKLKSFLKTSGGKGYHIVVPFTNCSNYNKFHGFAEKIAQILENKYPEKYTTNIRKVNRKGKIYIDYGRNTKGATSIAPYSVRARKGAKVSMPISFKELYKIAPNDIDIKKALERIKKIDPWKTFFLVNQEIKD